MIEQQPVRSPTDKRAIAASLGLHGLLLAIATSALMPEISPPAANKPIFVEVMSRSDFAALTAPAEETAEPLPLPQPVLPPTQTAPENEFTRATNLLSQDILNAPENAELRRGLSRFATSEQVIQLCNLEGLEQLRLAGMDPAPDALVGYAYADIKLAGFSLLADGGAFRSGGEWFHLRYRCAVASDFTSVTSFEFAPGEIIPHEEWDAHFLNADDDWLN